MAPLWSIPVWFGHWPVLSNPFFFSLLLTNSCSRAMGLFLPWREAELEKCPCLYWHTGELGGTVSVTGCWNQLQGSGGCELGMRKEGNGMLKGVKSLKWAMETVDLNVRVYFLTVISVKFLDNPEGKWWKSCTWRCFSIWVLMKAAENTYLHKNSVELDNLRVFSHL